jgi:hypothetical protein
MRRKNRNMIAGMAKKLAEAEALVGPAPVIGERSFVPTHTYLTLSGRRIKVELVPFSETERWNGTRVMVLTGRGDVWECHISKLTAIGGVK